MGKKSSPPLESTHKTCRQHSWGRFPGGRGVMSPCLLPGSAQCSTCLGSCDEGNAALLSNILSHLCSHSCKQLQRLQALEHSAGSGTLQQQKWALGRLSSTSTMNTENVCHLLLFLNKSLEGKEFQGSGHVLQDTSLNCHGLNNSSRPIYQHWYSVL